MPYQPLQNRRVQNRHTMHRTPLRPFAVVLMLLMLIFAVRDSHSQERDGSSTQNNIIRLLMAGEDMSNATWIVFREDGAMQQVTGDAVQLEPLSPHFVVLAVQKTDGVFDISLLPIPDESFEVPLVTRTTKSGTYTISVTNWDVAMEQKLLLEDRKLEMAVELREDMRYEFEFDQPLGKIAGSPLDVLSHAPMKFTTDAEPRFFITASEPVSAGTTEPVSESTELPLRVELSQNYPNPFNPSTIISYSLPAPTHVTLTVFDMLGRTVSILVDEVQPPGTHRADWDAAAATSGVYLYRLQAGDHTLTRIMTLLK